MRKTFFILLALLLPGLASAANVTVEITVAAGKYDRSQVPVRVPLTLPAEFAEVKTAELTGLDGKVFAVGQITKPGLMTESEGKKATNDLHFILPELKAGKSLTLKAELTTGKAGTGKESFHWTDKPGEFSELRFGDRPVLRYVCPTFDDSTPEKRNMTFKVFHHLYDPSGKRLVTKGPPGGLYPHHRGLFYGFRKVTYGDGKEVDIWHCTGDTYQDHEKTLEAEAGPVLGRHRVLLRWHGKGKEVFAREEREMTVYNVPGGVLVEFASRLTPTNGPVKLDGDPQHSGFHFRADNEVAERAKDKTKKETIFIRPDGVDKPGETRNWPDNKGHVNLPWDAMSFVLGGQRYTAAYLDRPSNPKEARYSERDYGRFGSYFVAEVKPDKPLTVNYRIWLQEGQMTVEEVAARSAAFVNPVEVTVK